MQAAGAENADSSQPPRLRPPADCGRCAREKPGRRQRSRLRQRSCHAPRRRLAAAAMNTVACARAISSGKWKGGVNPGARGLLTSLQAACSNLPSPGASPAPANRSSTADGAMAPDRICTLPESGANRASEPPPRATGWWSRNHRRRCTEASSRRLRAPGSPGPPPPPSPAAPETPPADAPQQPPRAQVSSTARPTTSSVPAGDSGQPRTSPASSPQRSASNRRDDVPPESLIEPPGRRLVGHRQQDGQRPVGEWFRTASSSDTPSTVTRTSP